MTTTHTIPSADWDADARTGRGCPFCRQRGETPTRCFACGAVGRDQHAHTEYIGGRGYRLVDRCHDTRACERRQEAR